MPTSGDYPVYAKKYDFEKQDIELRCKYAAWYISYDQQNARRWWCPYPAPNPVLLSRTHAQPPCVRTWSWSWTSYTAVCTSNLIPKLHMRKISISQTTVSNLPLPTLSTTPVLPRTAVLKTASDFLSLHQRIHHEDSGWKSPPQNSDKPTLFREASRSSLGLPPLQVVAQ